MMTKPIVKFNSKVPYWAWKILNLGKGSPWVGFNFWVFVWIQYPPEKTKASLLRHEFIHFLQTKEYGFWRFGWMIFKDAILKQVPYRQRWWEVEAYAKQNKPLQDDFLEQYLLQLLKSK